MGFMNPNSVIWTELKFVPNYLLIVMIFGKNNDIACNVPTSWLAYTPHPCTVLAGLLATRSNPSYRIGSAFIDTTAEQACW